MEKRIFIVEDEIIIARDIQRILERHGIAVAGVATRYRQALQEIPKVKPHLILCDIHLQHKNSGIELMEELSAKLCFEIIFITAYSDDKTVRNASSLHPLNYLTKPFNERQLLTSVRLALMSLQGEESPARPTARETEVLRLLSKGYTNEKISEHLFISALTVKTHRRNLLAKYNLRNTAELIALAINQKWI